MSYRSSRARREFEAQLRVALQELRPLHKVAKANGPDPAARLLGVYYVFAFTQLEVYVKSFVDDILDAISNGSPSFDDWPDLMLAYLLHRGGRLGDEYRAFGQSEDEGALLKKLGDTARKIAAWAGGGSIPVPLSAAQFLDKKGYPSHKNVEQLFKRLGVANVWAPLDAAASTNCKLILRSLNDLRTEIAHDGTIPSGFSIQDFRDRLNQMKTFVAAVDRGISKQFCSDMMTRSSWNAAMA